MTVYRCYFMSDGRIDEVRMIECTDDEVVMKAKTLINSKLDQRDVVIWHDDRLIASIPWRDTASQ